jgi:hypothetical protein
MWLLLLAHWRGITVGLLIAALAGGVVYYGHTRYEQGQQDGKISQLNDDAKAYKAQLEQRDAIIATAQQQIQAGQDRERQQAAVAAQLTTALTSLRVQSTTATQQVASIPNDGLPADIRAKLGLVTAGSDVPLSPVELREIDSRVTQYPIDQQIIAKDDQLVAALTGKAQAADDQIAALQTAATANQQLITTLQTDYSRCYAATQHRNWFLTIVTFGIKGSPRKLATK